MKRWMLLAALLMALTGCRSSAPAWEMGLEQAELSRQEQDILKLVGAQSGKIYDYQVNDTIKSMRIAIYNLEDGVWKEHSGYASAIEAEKGRFSIGGVGDEGPVRIGEQDARGNSIWRAHSDDDGDTANMGSMEQWMGAGEIKAEEPVVLMIQCFSDGGMLEGVSLEDFQNPQRLTGYDGAKAITVTFSQSPLG